MTVYDCFVNHGEPYSTPPDYSTDVYYLGIIPSDLKGVLETPFNWRLSQTTTYGSYSPTINTGPKYLDQITARFVPVNNLFLYWMFGKVSGTTTKTISPMDGAARKPRLGLWQTTDNLKYECNGSVFGNLDLEYSDGNGVLVSLLGKGLDHGENTDSPTKSYPSSIDTPFAHFNTCTWNGNNVLPSRFRFMGQQSLTPYPDVNGEYYQDINEFAPIFGTMNIQFTSAQGETIMSDFRSQTSRTFIWKFTKADPTKYFQVSSTCKIMSMIAVRSYLDPVVYSATLLSQAPTITGIDGVADAFYNIA